MLSLWGAFRSSHQGEQCGGQVLFCYHSKSVVSSLSPSCSCVNCQLLVVIRAFLKNSSWTHRDAEMVFPCPHRYV